MSAWRPRSGASRTRANFVAIVLLALAVRLAHADALSGTLTIVGSDTLSTLVLRWTEAFRSRHSEVRIQVQTPGSASAPIALLEGAADIGAMSRPMNDDERRALTKRYGYAPTEIAVAHDAIVVFVHPDNPLTTITRRQLDAIYSDTLRCGAKKSITTWNDLGVDPARRTTRILATGRNDASGTHEFFREEALCGGEYRADVVVWPGHGATVAAVAGNPEAIGYAGIGYVNGLVKPLAFALDDAAPAVEPVMQNVMDGEYALSRALYFYINQPPGHAPAALPAAFVDYALSDDAQAQVKQEGFLAATREERDTQRTRLHATIPSS
jgi:phosphate transport system substrate-binding protein